MTVRDMKIIILYTIVKEKTLDKAFVFISPQAVFHNRTFINKLLLMQLKSHKKAAQFLSWP